MPKLLKADVALYLLVSLPLLMLGQYERGTISGSVKDPSGAIIVGAKITVTNTATNSAVSLTSNESGDYTVPSLQVGTYSVRVEKEGFRPAVISGITLNAATDVRADATLEVGTTTTAVEVQASALQLATENAKTSVAVTNKLVDELPLVVSGTLRSPFDLASLTPESKNLGGDNGYSWAGDRLRVMARISTASRPIPRAPCPRVGFRQTPHHWRRSPNLPSIPTASRRSSVTLGAA
jgi:hypothetical protein